MQLSRALIDHLQTYMLTRKGPGTVGGTITPDTTEVYDLGSVNHKFDDIYSVTVHATNIIGEVQGNADTVDNIHAAATPTANYLLALNASAEFPTSVYPSALLTDGSRNLIGNLSVSAGVTIDGVDISAHAIDATIHHTGGMGQDDHSIYVHVSSARSISAQHTFTTSGAPFIIGGSSIDSFVDGLNADQLDGNEASVFFGKQYVVMSLDGDLTAERLLTAGDGISLTDGGAGGNATLDVGVSGLGLSVTGTDVVLTSSSNPGAAASILASDANGYLQVVGFGVGATPTASSTINIGAPGYVSFAGAAEISTAAGNMTFSAAGDVILNPTGDDVLPGTAYDVNLGALSNKYLTVHAAELWVETLVAQNTMATIGGRVLVTNTTKFVDDLAATTVNGANQVLNNSFETAGGGSPDIFSDWAETLGDGNIADETSLVYDGSHACKMYSGPSSDTVINQTFTVSPGDEIIYSFWTRGDGTYAGQYRIRDITNGADILAQTSTGVSGATYTKIYYKFTVPALCTSVRIYFYCPSTSTGTAYFDMVEMYDGVDMRVEHNQAAVDDIVRSESDGKVEWFRIYAGPTEIVAGEEYQYWVLRDLDGTGENDWYAGDALVNTGAIGDGFIDLYSLAGVLSGIGPTIVGNVRTGTAYNAIAERWAIGNLNGLFNVGAFDVYGVAFGNPDTTYIQIDDTDGYRIINNSVVVGQWAINGDFILGRVATNYSNMFWDQSLGQLNFRGGTNGEEVHIYFDIYGQLNAGGGKVVLNDTGINIEAQTSFGSDASYKFMDGSNVVTVFDAAINDGAGSEAWFGAVGVGTAPTDYDAYLRLWAQTATTSERAYLELRAGDDAVGTDDMYITLDTNSDYISAAGAPLSVPDGLISGAVATVPAAGELYTYADARIGGGLIVGSTTVNPAANMAIISGGLRVGDTTAPTDNDLHVVADIVAGSGLYVGNISGTPTADDIRADGDLAITGGVYAGSASGEPTNGNIHYTGNLVSRPSTTDFNVWALHMNSSPVTHSSYTGTAKSDTSGAEITRASWSVTLPEGVKALLIDVTVRDSGSSGSTDLYAGVGNATANWYMCAVRPNGITNDAVVSQCGIAVCDSNGSIWFSCNASGASTMDVWIRLMGYWI